MSLYKEIESWYSQKGISLQQFRDGSTEQYLDEMTHDFMRRMITEQSKLAIAVEALEKCEGLTMAGVNEIIREALEKIKGSR